MPTGGQDHVQLRDPQLGAMILSPGDIWQHLVMLLVATAVGVGALWVRMHIGATTM